MPGTEIKNLMQNPKGYPLPFMFGYSEDEPGYAWSRNPDGTLLVTYPDGDGEPYTDWLFPDDPELIVFGPVPADAVRPPSEGS